ncbi:MAG TPA: hypothetical protein VL360_01830 [Gammaproteobacteria bacterium]|nr:hypothetical protein [Gammaproteobacteria bacterium]
MRSIGCIKTSGITLIEMIAAVMITLILSSAVSKVYFTLRRYDNEFASLRRHQFRAQKIIDILQDDIGKAGYIGCAWLGDKITVKPYHQYSLTVGNYLEVTHDSLTLRYQLFPGAVLIQQNLKENILIADVYKKFSKNELLVISDCSHAEIFKIHSVYIKGDKQIIMPEEPLKHEYNINAEIGDLIVHRYYLDVSSNQLSLMRLEVDGSRNLLAEDVAGLSFENHICGVFYRLDTRDKNTLKKWSGYAGNPSRCQ